jgi:hypothetical protein
MLRRDARRREVAPDNASAGVRSSRGSAVNGCSTLAPAHLDRAA